MISVHVRLRPRELEHLRELLDSEPAAAREYASSLRDAGQRGLDVDKAWAALDRLLTRREAPVVVFGGGEALSTHEWGYDAPRLLDPDSVAEAARFLAATPFVSLAGDDALEVLDASGVYPGIWDEDWALDYLSYHYARLATLFRAAATAREPILTWTA
ncbi:DUF1877 family protein [Dactylosporangium salmoneum]|uniref:DUF1877 family protein n=1 Tax=Dactylosporangium salmoneum TaxID=53361 RepID=UPI0031D2E086